MFRWHSIGFAASLLGALVALSNSAAAQRSAQEFRFTEITPWFVKNKGPSEAKGVVYFLYGWNRRPLLETFQLGPYFINSLSEDGWDIVAAKIAQELPNQSSFEFGRRSHDMALPIVRQRLEQLRAKGYRRVVLAGHSWGGWVSLRAAQDSRLGADILLLSAPSVGKRVHQNGQPNPGFQRNFTEYPRFVSNIKLPTVLLLYAQDEEDPPGRGDVARTSFEKNKLQHLVVNHPPGFRGHFAGWLPLFDYLYGGCIRAFIDKPKSEACQPPALTNDDFRSIISLKQISDATGKRITSAGTLMGRRFAVFGVDAFNQEWHYVSGTRRHGTRAILELDETYVFRDGLHCAGSVCRNLVKWSDRKILEFDPASGNLAGWWIER